MTTTVRRKRTAEPLVKGATPSSRAEAQAIAESFSRKKKEPSPTSTTVPAGIAEHDPDVVKSTAVQVDAGEVREILVASCHPHPANIRPTPAEVAAIQQSYIDDGGQLEPIDVRLVDDGFQILSGETRWLAAKASGWRTIQARVRLACNDATAFHLLMVMNAKRRELSPIYKARMIEQATRPLAEGGGGKTLEAAGEVYGIKSAGGASNLKRLLQLPEVWQNRVMSRELPESFARLLLPYVHVPRLMVAIDADYRDEQKHRAKAKDPDDYDGNWESRAGLMQHLENIVDDHTRPIDKGFSQHYGGNTKGLTWHYSGRYERLFELTPEIEEQLDIYEIEIDGTKCRAATNITAYDKLQIPAIKAHVDAKNKRSATSHGSSAAKKSTAQKKPPTKAELDARKKEQAQQLATRIKAWRHKLLRHELIQAIEQHRDSGFRLVLALACHRQMGVDLAEPLAIAQGMKPDYRLRWSEVGSILPNSEGETMVIESIAKQLLALESNDKHNPRIAFDFIDAYAAAVGIDVAQAWRRLQQESSPLLEEFFLLHNREQMLALGTELGVHLEASKTCAVMAKLLSTRDRMLPLPKSVAPLKAAKAAAPAKKKAK